MAKQKMSESPAELISMKLHPAAPGAPEIIWEAVSQTLKETGGPVILIFTREHDSDEFESKVGVYYYQTDLEDGCVEKVTKDLAALEYLGFDTLSNSLS